MNQKDCKEESEALPFLAIMDDPSSSKDENWQRWGRWYILPVSKATRYHDDTNNTWITNEEDCKDLQPTTETYNLLIDVYSHAKTTSSSTQGVEIAYPADLRQTMPEN